MDGDTFFGRPLNREPPTNPMAEQALLGALLTNNKAYERVAEFLVPDHFADPANGRIYRAIARRVEAGQLADAVTLKAEFEHSGLLEEVGGVEYLGHLLTAMVGISQAGDYGRAVKDAWLRRQVIEVAEDTANLARGEDADVDPQEALTRAVDRLLALGNTSGADDSAPLCSAIDAALDSAEKAFKGETAATGLMTGIATLDALWRGMYPGALDMIAARSKHGKTALATQIAVNVADRLKAGNAGTPGSVYFVSLEMPRQDIAVRMLASETGISASDIRAGNIGDGRAERLVRARGMLRDLPMAIYDKPGATISEISTAVRAAHRKHRTRLVVVDHLHRIRPDKAMAKMPRVEQLQAFASALKDLAKSLGVPVLLLCQLSRDIERREDQRPIIADIQYAGETEADGILLLWRPELHLGACPSRATNSKASADQISQAASQWWDRRRQVEGKAEIIMAKSRFGNEGSVWLGFDGPRTTFFDLPPDEDAGAGNYR